MRINITKKSIIIDPVPKKGKKNGLKIYFQRIFDPKATTLPIITTDIIKGQRKYTLPKGINYTIRGIEV